MVRRASMQYASAEALIADIRTLRVEIIKGWSPSSSWDRAQERLLESGFTKERYLADRQIMEWYQRRNISYTKALTTADDNIRFWRECLRQSVAMTRIRQGKAANYRRLKETLMAMPGLNKVTGELVSMTKPSIFTAPTKAVSVIPEAVVEQSVTISVTAVREIVREMSIRHYDAFNEAVLEFASPGTITHKIIEYILAADKTIDRQEELLTEKHEENVSLRDKVIEVEELLLTTEDKLAQAQLDLEAAENQAKAVVEAKPAFATRLPGGFLRRGTNVTR